MLTQVEDLVFSVLHSVGYEDGRWAELSRDHVQYRTLVKVVLVPED